MLIDHRVVPSSEYRLAADLDAFCEQALASGVDGLGLAIPWAPFSRHPSVLEARYLEMLEVKALYGGALDVRVGLEVDLVREWMDEVLERTGGLDLDFISGGLIGTRRIMVDLPILGEEVRSAVLAELRELQDAATHRILGPDRGDAVVTESPSSASTAATSWPFFPSLVHPALELAVADVIELDRLGVDFATLLDGWPGRLVLATGATQPGGVGKDLARAAAIVHRLVGESLDADFESFPGSMTTVGAPELEH